MRRSFPAHLLIIAGAIAAASTVAHFAAVRFNETRQLRHLDEVGQIALRRAETSVQYGISALRELRDQAPSCDPALMQGVRLHAYRHSLIKDIRLVDAQAGVLCSAFSETLEFDKGWITRDDLLPMPGGDAHLFKVEQFFGTALGVLLEGVGPGGMVAILGISDSPLDLMPDALRASGQISLELAGGQEIASSGSRPNAEAGVTLVSAQSAALPLKANLRVSSAALETWEQDAYWPIVLIGAMLGAMLGSMLAKALLREPTQLELLDRAISAGEIRPYYQPLFDLRTGRITGAELLARWVKQDGTVIPPSRFIELAEQNGRIEALTWHLLRAGLDELKPVLLDDPRFKLSFNVTPSHFVSEGFMEHLRETVNGAGVPSRQVTLELTERESFEDPARAAEIVREVRSFGFKVALDDVGIGHSGLSQIQNLRADVLKIDKFFVDTLGGENNARVIVQTLVRLAADMGMRVVAEGIETEEQAEALRALGVESGQGYLVSPPMPGRRFIGFLEERPGHEARTAKAA